MTRRLIPYGRQFIDNSDVKAVSKTIRSGWITQGPTIEFFETKIAQKVGAKYAIAVANGTAALHAACFAAGIGPGDEVIVPTLTFTASANCVLFCNGTPVLCDIDPTTLTIDLHDAERKITKKTKAVIAVDFAGHSAEWDKLRLIAKKHNLILIDDAAHALGTKYKGKPIGTLADLTTFSFHPVKAITTGEGGMIVTNNKDYFDKMRLFRNHGIIKPINHPAWYQEMVEMGYNYRITDIQTSLGLSQFRKLDKFLHRRQEIALKYIQAFEKIKDIILPPHENWSTHAWHIFPIQFKSLDRNAIFDKLLKSGIKCQVHYLPIHLHPYYQKKLGYRKGDFPNAEKYFSRCLTIPLFAAMDQKMVNKVIQEIVKVTS
jgi:UDP-4-amino-4,6-dideoxy-N-acetyl-beta-L-altrosamine transaminase